MSEEGDIPSGTEVDKSTAPTLLQRFGSLPGTKKIKENEKLTEENEALKKKVSQLTKEAEERQGKIDQYTINQAVSNKRISDLEDDINTKSTIISNLTKEAEERQGEIDQYKKSDAELKCQLAKMESETKANSKEIEYLKKSEDELKNRISQLEDENNSKSAKIENLNLEMSQNVRKILEKMDTTSIDLRSLHDKTPDMTLRARFTGISKLTYTYVFSQWTELAGVKWRIFLRKDGDYLRVFVHANICCTASVVLQLISQKNENVVQSQSLTKYDGVWGFDNFISFKDLFDEEKGYVKDDSIIFAATIKVFPDAQ